MHARIWARDDRSIEGHLVSSPPQEPALLCITHAGRDEKGLSVTGNPNGQEHLISVPCRPAAKSGQGVGAEKESFALLRSLPPPLLFPRDLPPCNHGMFSGSTPGTKASN